MKKLELPPHLTSEIENGNAVLMLGAGASLEAKNERGEHSPTASKLASLIASKFLPEKFRTYALNQVAEFAIAETDLFTVQDFIASIFDPLIETKSHELMTSFRWRAIVTTNYDTLIEKAYRKATSTVQSIVPFIDNTDRIDDKIKDRNDLPLIKLHGCITRTRNEDCPLIITTDQYVSYSKGRTRLFNLFKEYAAQRSILYVGYGIQDHNLRQIINELEETVPSRPRCYLILPGITDLEIRVWNNKKITAIDGTFDDLFFTLDTSLGATFRGAIPSTKIDNDDIKERFLSSDTSLSAHTTQFLENDVEYVGSAVSTGTLSPPLFYKGMTQDWCHIEQELDVQRHLTDTLLLKYFIDPSPAANEVRMFVITSYAGAGKSVLLQRLAWDAAKTYKRLCLFLLPSGVIDSSSLAEIAELTNEEVFLFVDNLLEHRREIERLFSNAKSIKGRITILGTARKNEWNVASDSLTTLAAEEYELPYLSNKEIDELLALLEKHKALGTLERMSLEERRRSFDERHGRQLLVALHEATLGRRFEDIIFDEYESIRPATARQMYLTVCFLNQYRIPVRAGVIARRHNITFEQFRSEFFLPLEHLVSVDDDKRSRDQCYLARHSHIAEIVVRQALKNREDLFNETVRTLKCLNPLYNSDQSVLRIVLQGRAVLDTFPDHDMARQIYEAASEILGEDGFLYQQMTIYEMNRPNGNLETAESYIRTAVELLPRSHSVQHTSAELYVRKATSARTALEEEKYLRDAAKICHELKSRMTEAYPYYTLVKIGTMRIKAALASTDGLDAEVERLVKEVQQELAEGQQRYPENAQLHSVEAELARILSQSQKAMIALRKSFDLNNRNVHIGIRLAKTYEESGNPDEAIVVLKKALEAKRNDQRVNYCYGELLLQTGKGSDEEVLYYAERGYSPGDSNYEAQFLHARQLFVVGQFDLSAKKFFSLRSARLGPDARNLLRYPLANAYSGFVSDMDLSHVMIKRDGDGEKIFCHRSRIDDPTWRSLSYGTRVQLHIGFTMGGANGFDLKLV